MAARTVRNLSAVSRTLMTPLYIRAMESRRPDAIVHDPRALEVVGRLDYDFSLVRSRKKGDRVSMLMRMREFDRLAREFLTQHPDMVLVDLDCGLDTRFDRIGNGRMEWHGLD
jgi:O-methyltransferase involved in polyketide biosynthesis